MWRNGELLVCELDVSKVGSGMSLPGLEQVTLLLESWTGHRNDNSSVFGIFMVVSGNSTNEVLFNSAFHVTCMSSTGIDSGDSVVPHLSWDEVPFCIC